MYEDYYLGYPELEEALAAAGYSAPAASPASVAGIGSSAATAAPATAPSVLESALAASAAGQGLTQGQYDALADRRAAANTRPQGTFLAAPTDNRGKATGFDIAGQGSNLFEYQGGPVRVTDRNGKVLFSGDGPEGALEAVKFAQNLSATKGKNASWDIQQLEKGPTNPDGSSYFGERWVSGPTDAKEGMGVVGDIAAFALPIAAAVLTAGMSLPYQIAAAASAGMVGGVMSGKDPLKSALIAGASAGAMNVSGANAAIGKAVNNISNAVTNAFVSEAAKEAAEEVVKNAVGELGEQIVVTAISKTIQGVGNSLGNTLLSEVVKNAGVGDITGYKTPAEKFVEQTQPEVANPVVDGVDQVTGEIVASGERIGAVADTAANVITGIGSSAATDAITGFETPTEKFVQETPAETTQTDSQTPAEDTIVVSGERIGAVADTAANVITGIGTAAANTAINQPAATEPKKTAEEISEEESGEIVSFGEKTTPVNVPVPGIGSTAAKTVINETAATEPKKTAEEISEEESGEIVSFGEKTTPVNVPVPGIGSTAANTAINQTAATEPKKTAEEISEEESGEIVSFGEKTTPVNVPVPGIGSTAAKTVINETAATEPKKTAEEISEEESGEIVSFGEKTTPVNVPVPGIGSTAAKTVINETAAAEPKKTAEEISEEESGEIVSFGEKTTPVNVPVPETVVLDTGLGTKSVTDTLPLPKADPALTEKTTLEKLKDAAQIVSAASTLVPLITDAIGGGGGGGGTLPADTTRLNFTPTTLRSTLTGGIGGAGARYPYTPTTYGQAGGDQETEFLFFTKDPITGQESIQSGTPVTTTNTVPAAAPGKKEGGEIEDDMVKHLVEYHKNGGHQGPGQVKGIGSGQDDKIPAWLSDGEYVWSAQDVADLGDGSTDEGVRRLDKMRQMVRRQAGRKDVKKIAKPQKGIDTMLKAVGGLA